MAPDTPAAQRFSRAVEAYEFSAKIICGVQNEAGSLRLAAGLYATAVNVRNPHTVDIKFEKHLSLTFPPGQQTPGAIHRIGSDRLGPSEALMVDCEDLRNEVFPYGYPTPYIEGFLTIQSPQDVDVISVSTAATLAPTNSAKTLSSIDIEQVSGRRIAVELSPPAVLPPLGPDLSKEDLLCAALAQASAIVEGTVASITYTFDEAPGEGPREIIKLIDVEVHAGGGGVLEQPFELLQLGGYLPGGDALSVSHIPVLSVGKRYIIFLRNTLWKLSPILLDFYFRREIIQGKQVLVDQDGFGVTDVFSGRLNERLFEAEQTGEPPALINAAPDGLQRVMSPGDFVEQLKSIADTCPGPILSGVFAPYPIIPWDVTRGSPSDLGLIPP